MRSIYIILIVIMSMTLMAFSNPSMSQLARDTQKSTIVKAKTKDAAKFKVAENSYFPGNRILTEHGDLDITADTENFKIVHFWATWCNPCIKEMSKLDKFTVNNNIQNLKVHAVSIDFKGLDVVKNFYKRAGINNLPAAIDVKHKNYDSLEFHSVPATVILNPQNKVIAVAHGSMNWDSSLLEKDIAGILKKNGG